MYQPDHFEEKPFCARCQEDFPIAPEPTRWAMGSLRPLGKAPKAIRSKYCTELQSVDYLCGNCYFDLTDEE